MSRFNIYSTGHAHSQAVCSALARGTGYPVVAPTAILDGGVVAYGFLRGLLPILRQAQAEERPWVYADRGYFRVTYGDDYSGYFRLTRNAYQYRGLSARRDADRWRRLLLPIHPWRRGRHVVVCPPGEIFAQAVGGFAAAEWEEQTLAALRAHTDREVRIRRKPKPGSKGPTLAADLQDCHALVTFMSNTAVEALLAGVPVFCTGKSAAQCMGLSDLSKIESPVYPDHRQEWAETLASNQWTLDEIKRGLANEVFK